MKKIVLALLLVGCKPNVQLGDKGKFDPPAPLSFASEPRFVLTVNLSDELAYVAEGEPTLLGEIPVGNIPVELEGPHHVAASPDGKFIFVNVSNYVPGTGSGPHGSHGTGTVPGSLFKIDARTSQKVAEVIVDRSPGDVILSSDGKTAYITHYDLLRLQSQLLDGSAPEKGWSAIAVVDTERMTRLALLPVCPTAHGEGLSPDGTTLYVTCALSDELAVIDVRERAKPKLLKKLPVGPAPGPLGAPTYSPYALSVSPSDGSVWVSDNSSADVRVYDPTTMAMDPRRTIPVGGVAMFGAFTADGKTYYVPHQGDDKVTAVDTATLAVRNLSLPNTTCLNAHAIALAPDEKTAVVVCEGDHRTRPGSAVMLNLEGFFIMGSVEVGMFPDGAVWLPPL